MKQTIRDVATSDVTLEYFMKRSAEGWKLASIEWVREVEGTSETGEISPVLVSEAETPYGLQIEDGRMAENPLKSTVLLLILEQIVQEKRINEIAWQLNLQGYKTREGKVWSASDVFNLLPRLIDVGPSLLKSQAWHERRPASAVTH